MKLFDVVALTENLPNACLQIGQVGTFVKVYKNNIFEVEFCKKKAAWNARRWVGSFLLN